jgi:hypothetical protein
MADRWTWECEQVRTTVMSMPSRFGLRAFPDRIFQVSLTSSYWNGEDVILYVYILHPEKDERGREVWASFAKGTKQELLESMVEVPYGV